MWGLGSNIDVSLEPNKLAPITKASYLIISTLISTRFLAHVAKKKLSNVPIVT